MQSAETTSPYPGPRPFTTAERARFFGRTREQQDLASLVIAQPVTLLHGPLGAGKTSLICAGVVPELERAGLEVMPIARVGGLLPPGTDAARLRNVFTYSVLLHWTADAGDSEALSRHTLLSYLRALPKSDDGVVRPRVLVLDQLEALFVAYPAQWDQREAFLRELADCLRPDRSAAGDPPLRLLLALRDDHLGELERHAHLFPDGLRVRLALDALRVPAAVEAIAGPSGNLYSVADAEQLARNLAQRRVRLQNGKHALIPADRVEPMQLQLACHERWQRGGRSGALAKPRDADEALTRFYDGAIARARSGFRSERRLRRFVADRLLTADGVRTSVLRGPKSTGGLANRLVDALEREQLLRADSRGGATWVELVHDRLVAPALLSNRVWSESQARRRRAWRFVLFMLLFAGLVVGLTYLGQLALARWDDLKAEKAGLERQLTALDEGGASLSKQLAESRAALLAEQHRVQLTAFTADLRILNADAQLLQTVLFDMGRYRPSLRDVDTEAETLMSFVTSGQALASVAAQAKALASRQQTLVTDIAATATQNPGDTLKPVFAELTNTAEELAPQLQRLQETLTAMTGEHSRYSVRLSANLDGWEAPPRPGASLQDRVRETSRAQWRAGLRLLLAGDLAGARGRFQRAVERDTTNPAASDALARMSWSEGKVEDAERDYRFALTQNNDYGPALAGLAEVYLHKESLADADRCVRKALAVQPDFAPAHLVLDEIGRRLALQGGKLGKSSKDNPCKKRAAPVETPVPAAPADAATKPAE